MSKSKLFGIGLASILSVVSVGCSKQTQPDDSAKEKSAEVAQTRRQKNGREDISVSYIKRTQDYVKSVNCLLSLYKDIIPMVEKTAPTVGIETAMKNAYAECRKQGKLKENSVAFNFDDLVEKNYGGQDLTVWKESFARAGQEAVKILAEGDSVSRTFVPVSTSGKSFLRRDLIETNENTWKTADAYENWNTIREGTRNFSGR